MPAFAGMTGREEGLGQQCSGPFFLLAAPRKHRYRPSSIHHEKCAKQG
jgi:hypothetical protein